MPNEGVDIRVRTTGARRAAKDVNQVDRAVGGLDTRARRATGGLRVFNRVTASATGGLRLMGGAALYGGAALGGTLLIGLKRSTDAWQEKRKIVAQTEAVLRSTGGAAGVAASDVERLSNVLSRSTGIDDEVIRDAQNLLLTFRDIRNGKGAGNDIFTQSTKTALDLAAAMKMGPRQAALQIGKALNDPERGFKRLQRIGVSFSKQQEEQIENYSAQGERAKAQRVILAELRKEFGGSAAAQATALDRLGVSWGNIEEAIGRGVSPAVDAIADDVDGFLRRAEPGLDALGARLGKLFERDDLDLSEKLSLAGKDLSRTTRPLRQEIGKELERLDIGGKVADGLEREAPRIMEAMGRVAAKGAGAFLKAWWESGVTGKLFTLALIGGKLGAFSALGGLAWRRFRRSWKRNAAKAPISPTVAPPVPVGGPGGAAGKGKGGWLGKIGKGLGKVGRGLGAAGLAAAAYEVAFGGTGRKAKELGGNIGHELGELLGTNTKKPDRVKDIEIPNVFGRKSAPAARPRPRQRVKAGSGRPQTIVIHTTATMPLTADGARLVARSVNRVNADTRARG